MTRERIGRTTLEERLPAILREQYRLDGLPADHEPSWKYITANTRYSAQGLHNKSKELYGQSLLEFLRNQGFGLQSPGRWPTDDERTIQSLQYFFESAEDRKKWDENTVDSIESTINKVYEAIRAEELDVEVLDLGHYECESERQENIQHAVTIIEYMERNLKDGTVENYSRYFSDYYTIVKNNFTVNTNPVEDALDEFDFHRTYTDAEAVTAAQLNDLWNALDTLRECPVEGYELDEWRLWMKMLIVFLIAVGPRSSEVEQVDLREHFHFGDDPHVQFEERKNLRRDDPPVKVPIMMAADYLRIYREYKNATDRSGKLVPSNQSASGCRTASTLNEWLERLCKIADVRLDDGSFPTIQNFRQFWKTNYKKALAENREEINFIAEEDGKEGPESDEQDYITNEQLRKDIRDLGRDYFDDVLDLDGVPELLDQELDGVVYGKGQTNITDYGVGL